MAAVPLEAAALLAGGDLPQPGGAVATAGGERPAVRRDAHELDATRMAEAPPLLARGDVPQPNRLVLPPTGDEGLAVRREDHRPDRVEVSAELAQLLAA